MNNDDYDDNNVMRYSELLRDPPKTTENINFLL